MVTQPPSPTLGQALLNRLRRRPERALLVLLVGAGLAVLGRPWWHAPSTSLQLRSAPLLPAVAQVEDLKEIVVATRLAPTTYLTQPDGNTVGLEKDLVLELGSALHKPVRFLVLDNQAQVLEAVLSGRAHFGAAAIAVTADLSSRYHFTPPYHHTHLELVYNEGLRSSPHSPGDLQGHRVGVSPDPTLVAQLKTLQGRYPDLAWITEARGDLDLELLQEVFDGTLEYAITDQDTLSIAHNYYPDLKGAFALGPERPIAWVFPKRDGDPLYQAAVTFMDGFRRSGGLEQVIDRYYGGLNHLDRQDALLFLEKRVSRLPHLSASFLEAAADSGLDWRLIAAMAFQESHWDNQAVSPTGVRGLMMLTADTADRLGVSDRLDPTQAVPAAARYLARIRDELPASIPEPDRTWMALAAYDIGNAHLEDARLLARRQGLDPNRWSQLRQVLPLLASPVYYPTLRYGFARGGEPVREVDNIRSYYDILCRFEKKSPLQPLARRRN